MKNITVQIVVKGLVQGVGFRPFVYKIAMKFGLAGWVKNTNENVILDIEDFPRFQILESHNVSEGGTVISTDITVCNDSLKDIELQGNRLEN